MSEYGDLSFDCESDFGVTLRKIRVKFPRPHKYLDWAAAIRFREVFDPEWFLTAKVVEKLRQPPKISEKDF